MTLQSSWVFVTRWTGKFSLADPASLSRLSLLLSLSVPLPSLSPLSFSHPSPPPPLPSRSPSLPLSVGVRRGLNESLISSCWMSLRWWRQFSCCFKGNWVLTKFGCGFCFSPLNQLGASHQVQVARLSSPGKTTVEAAKPKWQWSVVKGRPRNQRMLFGYEMQDEKIFRESETMSSSVAFPFEKTSRLTVA